MQIIRSGVPGSHYESLVGMPPFDIARTFDAGSVTAAIFMVVEDKLLMPYNGDGHTIVTVEGLTSDRRRLADFVIPALPNDLVAMAELTVDSLDLGVLKNGDDSVTTVLGIKIPVDRYCSTTNRVKFDVVRSMEWLERMLEVRNTEADAANMYRHAADEMTRLGMLTWQSTKLH